MLEGSAVTFISRRDSHFRDYPPAAANLAVIVPFFGALPVWVRPQANRGWQFPAGSRKAGETIGEAAKRLLWDTTRLAAARLDLLGCLARNGEGKARVAYVYTCASDRLAWTYERPSDAVEVGIFVNVPKPVDGDWCATLLEVEVAPRGAPYEWDVQLAV